MNKINYIFFFLFLFNINTSYCQSVTLEEYSTGYNWLIGFETAPGDDRIHAFQKDGFIKICNTDGSIETVPFLDISTQVNNSFNNEQGLLGLAFHPDYQANGYCFVFYNELGTGDVKIVRFERNTNNPDQLDPSTETLIMTWPHPKPNHIGGCMKFGPDGHLYIASGDGGGAGDPDGNGQNLMTYLGKVLRIDVDKGQPYTIPNDNPYVGALSVHNEIWAYGLRNPWRFSFDKKTGDLWIADVGQDEREEINYLKYGEAGGQNYGWSCKEGSLTFDDQQCFAGAEFTDPIFEYAHNLVLGDCSISGGVVYRGTEYADLYGKYIFTDFCSGRIWSLEIINNNPEVEELGNFGNNDFTVLDENENGELFISGFFSNKIYKIIGECKPVAIIENPSDIIIAQGETVELNLFADPDYEFQWYLNNTAINGANSLDLTASQAGEYSVVVTNPDGGCSNTSNIVAISNNTISVELNGPVNVCEESTFTYVATSLANASYTWSVTGGTVVGESANEVEIKWGQPGPGLLTVQVTDTSGTVDTAELAINIFENFIELFGDVQQVSCPGFSDGAINLFVNLSEPLTYLWSNGATTEDISNLPVGVYAVTVTNTIGCSKSMDFVVEGPSAPTVNIITEVTCDGFLALPEIPIDSFLICDINWDVPNPDSVTSGTYVLTITDCNGCEYVNAMTISIPPVLMLDYTTIEPTPGNSDGSISLELTGGTAPYEYQWNTGATTPMVDNLPAGIYTVLVTDIAGCTAQATITLGGPLSTNDLAEIAELSISPNPFHDQFDLFFELKSNAEIAISISDVAGRKMMELMEKKDIGTGSNNHSINTVDWPNGIYFILIETNENRGYYKIVKQ